MNTDHWVKDDQMFICDGRGYVLNKYLDTICVGPVDDGGNVLSQQNEKEVVSKIETIPNHNDNVLQIQSDGNYETPKKRGRPKKEVGLSRVTRWRRKKEGVLV